MASVGLLGARQGSTSCSSNGSNGSNGSNAQPDAGLSPPPPPSSSSPSVQLLTPTGSSNSGGSGRVDDRRGATSSVEGGVGYSERDFELQHLQDIDNDDGDDEDSARRRRRRSSSSYAWAMAARRGHGSRRGWPYTAKEERAVVRKFDRRLVLFVAMLYMLSFLDRSNIGNARVAGMDDDLQTTPPRDDWYAWALSAFYLTYIAFEWMALLWRVVPAHVYVALLVAGWGTAASLQALAGSYPWLIALRAVLGIGEAGFAGIPLYLAQFFRRDELAVRTAVFIAAAPLATTFAASLAWAILALGRLAASPIAAWRLLFLVEGFPSVVAAIVAWRVIPDAPDKAHYLSRREKTLARLRLADDRPADDGEDDDGGGAAAADEGHSGLAALADPAAWITAVMFFFTNMAYASLPVFLPTILTAMGHDAVTAQALAAPPYLAAFVLVLATAHVSDAMRARAPLLVAHALASAAGYAVLSVGSPPLGRTSILRYLAVFPAAVGFFNVVVLLIAWNLNNQRGARRQGAAFALFQVAGQCGPLVGTRMYPDADGPLFLRGMRTMAGAMLAVALLAVVLRVVLRRRNQRLDAAEALRAGGGGEEGEEEEEGDGDGDDSKEQCKGEEDDEDDGRATESSNEEQGLVDRRRRRGRGRTAVRHRQETAFRYML